ncbi:MAG: ABC transporter permease [Clostridiales bacterium]|nr:ABC transporter permease [Clostridiales bacterium]
MESIGKSIKRTAGNLRKNKFLFEELVKRDFEQKYKRTILGMGWSVLAPLLQLLVMKIVFTEFFGKNTPHFTMYLLSGNVVMSYYKEATKNGMTSLVSNSSIITKINVPKYLFLFSKNVSALVNMGLTMIVFFFFCIIDHITFHVNFVMLLYPIICLLILNLGVGMILSALYVFFRDITYLYDIFLTILTYLSAIFYTIDRFPEKVQRMFLLNPVYVIIKYFRVLVIDGQVPSLQYHMLCMGYALFFFIIGCIFYKAFNKRFVYYF